MEIEKISGSAFLPFPECKAFMLDEFASRLGVDTNSRKEYGDLVYLPSYSADCAKASASSSSTPRFLPHFLPYFCATALLEPFIVKFNSIGEAANALKGIQRSWAPYSFSNHRRQTLIQEKLPYIPLKPRNFPVKIPQSPMGFYTLLDEHTLLASASTSSCIPLGTLNFEEDHENPPSRAYLKIQEALTLFNHFFGDELPSKESLCFEAGACPGGWTYVLTLLGARVFAVDRSPLAPSLMENPLVTFSAHDAFTLKPSDVREALGGDPDWILSDVICYPERLLQWVKTWLESGIKFNMICTIKMQGGINWQAAEEFASLPNSRVVHLHYNKHELTFLMRNR